MGVEASTIGNHEFDLGSRVFRDSFIAGSGYVGAQFPYLSANLDFSGDTDLSSRYTNTTATAGLEQASTLRGRIVPSAVLDEGGQKIGLVGATTQLLEAIASPSGTEVRGFPTGPGANGEVDNMDLLATQLQPVIDDLIAQGVNKIIVMSHLQVLANERLLATKLSGVDIILAAGSNTRLGDANDTAVAFPGHSANFADTYPLVIKDKTGGNTLVVNTDNEFTYLGRLVVDFDNAGNVRLDSLAANNAINGAYAATDANVNLAWGSNAAQAYATGTRGAQVKTVTDAVQSVITTKDGNVYGYSNVYLEGERIAVRNQETNLGNLSADANGHALKQALGSQAAAQTYIVSIKNGGGIRAQIGTLSAPKADGSVDKLPPDGGVPSLTWRTHCDLITSSWPLTRPRRDSRPSWSTAWPSWAARVASPSWAAWPFPTTRTLPPARASMTSRSWARAIGSTFTTMARWSAAPRPRSRWSHSTSWPTAGTTTP
jgi:2',3'-cyclic-nucleotide 2'-phosphodiesterase (5'-nucleotidase family)